jgi:hypothetical protein
MANVDTVNHVREINTNLTPITIPTDAGKSFELPALTYRERLRLAEKLLIATTDHPSTAKFQAPSSGAVIRQMVDDATTNLLAEQAEAIRIELALKKEGCTKGPSGAWFDAAGIRLDVDTTLPIL